MRFSVSTRVLPWRVRLAVLFGARVVSGAFVHPDGGLVITVGVRRGVRGPFIWWQEWRPTREQSASFFATGLES
jgi:hypothetical protein